MPVAHVLFDADGVLQELPGGWVAALEPWVGERAAEFLAASVRDEQPCLVGRGRDFADLLAERVRHWGLDVDPAALYADVWHRIEVDPASLALVADVRATGAGVHLATTQESGRAAVMERLYDGVFDSAFVSCRVGHQKTQREFFAHVLQALGAPGADVLFIDDHEPNVVAAREAGLRAERWHLREGHDLLREHLARHGLSLR